MNEELKCTIKKINVKKGDLIVFTLGDRENCIIPSEKDMADFADCIQGLMKRDKPIGAGVIVTHPFTDLSMMSYEQKIQLLVQFMRCPDIKKEVMKRLRRKI